MEKQKRKKGKSRGALVSYTTSVPVNRTVNEIERVLTQHGAIAIQKQYDGGGYCTSVAFKITGPEGDIPFLLPMDVEAVQQVLKNQYEAGKIKSRDYTDLDHARRVGWRIVLRWVEAQMAIIETRIVTIEQVFLPYAVTKDGRTIYEKYIEAPKYFMLPRKEKD